MNMGPDTPGRQLAIDYLVDEVRLTLLALVGPCWWQLTKHNEPAVEPASERNASDWLFNYANQ